MDFTRFFIEKITNDKDFQEAFLIVKNNSKPGNIWVIGGLVYRNIVGGLYKKKGNEIYDFDFLVENPVKFEQVNVPADWNITRTGLGEPRFINGQKQIDLASLDNAINPSESENLSNMNSEEKLQSYFRRVPLNVQAIAYDTIKKKIVGEMGIEAIKDKKIQINNLDECISFCRRHRMSVDEFINKKANALGFETVFTPAKIYG
jgi:hypothetical protein